MAGLFNLPYQNNQAPGQSNMFQDLMVNNQGPLAGGSGVVTNSAGQAPTAGAGSSNFLDIPMQGQGYTPANTGGGDSGFFSQEGAFGESGWFGPAMQGVGALTQAWNGKQQLDIAKDQLDENKRQFNLNWNAQKKMTNSRLRDRQRARRSANPNAYQSVDDYMNQNKVE